MNINQHDLSDDELDHLFRDSAGSMDFDFDPASWTKMSQKLDAVILPALDENQAKNVWFKRSLSILLALFFLISGYFLFTPQLNQAKMTLQAQHKNSSENESEGNEKKHVTTDKVDTDNSKDNTFKETPDLEKNINNSKSTSYDKKIGKNNTTNTSKVETKDINLAGYKIENISKSQKNDIVINKNSTKVTTKQAIKGGIQSSKTNSFSIDKQKNDLANISIAETNLNTNERFSGKNKIGNKSLKENSDISNFQVNNNIANANIASQEVDRLSQPNASNAIFEEKKQLWQLENLKSLTPKSGLFKSNFNLPIVAFESQKTDAPIPSSQNTSFKKGLYLRLGVSPDFSIVTIDEIARLGSNWPAMLEYRLNNRFSVHTGVIRSMKYYNSYPASYEWPGNWPQPPVLIDINATCKMLDIPLNVRYDISQKPNSRLFVSAGSTSYIMLNEKYTYNYENQSDPKIKWRNWEGKTGPYYFSVLNFSFGYEYQVFRRLSFQAEPFLKVPIGKVGFGKVNLSTVGIFVTAKYPIAKF